jgi:hypothetical protein
MDSIAVCTNFEADINWADHGFEGIPTPRPPPRAPVRPAGLSSGLIWPRPRAVVRRRNSVIYIDVEDNELEVRDEGDNDH